MFSMVTFVWTIYFDPIIKFILGLLRMRFFTSKDQQISIEWKYHTISPFKSIFVVESRITEVGEEIKKQHPRDISIRTILHIKHEN